MNVEVRIATREDVAAIERHWKWAGQWVDVLRMGKLLLM